MVCWIPTSAVHTFKWDSSCCESCYHNCDKCTRKLIFPLFVQSRLESKRVPWMAEFPLVSVPGNWRSFFRFKGSRTYFVCMWLQELEGVICGLQFLPLPQTEPFLLQALKAVPDFSSTWTFREIFFVDWDGFAKHPFASRHVLHSMWSFCV